MNKVGTTFALISASWSTWRVVEALQQYSDLKDTISLTSSDLDMDLELEIDIQQQFGQEEVKSIDSPSSLLSSEDESNVYSFTAEENVSWTVNGDDTSACEQDQEETVLISESNATTFGMKALHQATVADNRSILRAIKVKSSAIKSLKMWCVLALLRLYEEYAEFIVSWFPGYSTVKFMGLMYFSCTHASELIASLYRNAVVGPFAKLERWLHLCRILFLKAAIQILENLNGFQFSDLSQEDLIKCRAMLVQLVNQQPLEN